MLLPFIWFLKTLPSWILSSLVACFLLLMLSALPPRGIGSTFDPILGNLKKAGVGAINWGLVDGKSQTIYLWDTWKKIYTGEPALWHHDVFRADGAPYRPEEAAYIKSVTKP